MGRKIAKLEDELADEKMTWNLEVGKRLHGGTKQSQL